MLKATSPAECSEKSLVVGGHAVPASSLMARCARKCRSDAGYRTALMEASYGSGSVEISGDGAGRDGVCFAKNQRAEVEPRRGARPPASETWRARPSRDPASHVC